MGKIRVRTRGTAGVSISEGNQGDGRASAPDLHTVCSASPPRSRQNLPLLATNAAALEKSAKKIASADRNVILCFRSQVEEGPQPHPQPTVKNFFLFLKSRRSGCQWPLSCSESALLRALLRRGAQ